MIIRQISTAQFHVTLLDIIVNVISNCPVARHVVKPKSHIVAEKSTMNTMYDIVTYKRVKGHPGNHNYTCIIGIILDILKMVVLHNNVTSDASFKTTCSAVDGVRST